MMVQKRKYIFWLLVIYLLPIVVFAKTTTSGGSVGSCPEIKDPNQACKNQVGISISGGKYYRGNSRKITITPKDSSLEYKAFMIVANEGSMDELELDEKVTRGNLKDVIDDMDDVQIKVKQSFKETFDTWQLAPGKDAVIIVILKDDSTRPDCCATDDNGTCSRKLQCSKGNFAIKKGQDFEEVQLQGNSAFLYVQNPAASSLVTNIRYGTDVCINSFNGKHPSEPQYNLEKWKGDKTIWQTQYYNKFLDYCNQNAVAFNLTEKHIDKITDQLLKIYYYQKKLGDNAPKSISSIDQQITSIKNSIVNTYCHGRESGCKNIIKNDLAKLKSIGTTCNPKAKNRDQEDYLYISKQETIKTAPLSNDATPWVCKTKCYEHLSVVYSPPVAVKAGLCFSYKVTVKTKTDCGVDINHDILNSNALAAKSMCSPVPICENDKDKTQAGPNEDFDQCIQSCDQGEYTQSCINRCYKKVYQKVTKTTKATNEKGNSVQYLINTNPNSNLVRIKNSEDCDGTGSDQDPACFKYYYLESKVASDCGTKDIISYVHNGNKNKLMNCAKYFTKAKLTRPMGTYQHRTSGDDRDWGEINWNPTKGEITNSDSENPNQAKDIPMSIGRASPFYFRSVDETYQLLISLVEPTKAYRDSNKYWKKYVIKSHGIKRQYSSRFKCSEVCYYTGCNKNDAMTSEQYAKDLSNDLKKVAQALSKCSTTSACDTTEKTATFNIQVKTNTDRGDQDPSKNEKASPSKNGTNTSAINPSSLNTIGRGDQGMFIPAETDDASKTKTGIYGLCYDPNNKNPHYQTTITFPGSWINLKTGEVEYTEQNNETYRPKNQYYCTPYDAKEVNTKWWNYAVNGNYDLNQYPINFTPTYNISASSTNFGKYNWSVHFQCFYALYNETELPPPDAISPNPPYLCYRGNAGTEEVCPSGDGDKESTKLNYDFKIIALDNMFPRNRLRGYNWGSAATLSSTDQEVQKRLQNGGYHIDPVQYSQDILNQGEKVYQESPDFRFTLSNDNINRLKKESLDFNWGSYKEEVIPGLRYYYINDANISGKVSEFTRSWTPGKNNG